MKGIVADLAVGTHGENGLPGCPKGSTKKFAVFGTGGIASVSIRWFMRQTCRQLLSDELRDRRSFMLQARKCHAQGAFACRTQFAADRIIVMQIERA